MTRLRPSAKTKTKPIAKRKTANKRGSVTTAKTSSAPRKAGAKVKPIPKPIKKSLTKKKAPAKPAKPLKKVAVAKKDTPLKKAAPGKKVAPGKAKPKAVKVKSSVKKVVPKKANKINAKPTKKPAPLKKFSTKQASNKPKLQAAKVKAVAKQAHPKTIAKVKSASKSKSPPKPKGKTPAVKVTPKARSAKQTIKVSTSSSSPKSKKETSRKTSQIKTVAQKSQSTSSKASKVLTPEPLVSAELDTNAVATSISDGIDGLEDKEIETIVVVEATDDSTDETSVADVEVVERATVNKAPIAKDEPPPPFNLGEQVKLIQNTRPRTGAPIGNLSIGALGKVETVLGLTAIVRFDIQPDSREVVAFTCLESLDEIAKATREKDRKEREAKQASD